MEQRSIEWFSSRIGVLTGTTFKDCMSNGEAKKTLINTKIAEILTGEIPTVTAKSLEYGIEHEPDALSRYMFETGLEVTETGLIFHPENASIAVSPDGLINNDGGIEIKCPATSKEHINHIINGLPAKYKPQVQGCLWVTGRSWWDFVSYDPRMPMEQQLHIQRIEPDVEYIEKLEAGVLDTLQKIENGLNQIQPLPAAVNE